MESTKSDTDSSVQKEFLDEFCTHRELPLSNQTSLPYRVLSVAVTEEEIEGECLDWLQQFLHTLKCPSNLRTTLAREVTDQVVAGDLSGCVEPAEEKEEPLAATEDNKVTQDNKVTEDKVTEDNKVTEDKVAENKREAGDNKAVEERQEDSKQPKRYVANQVVRLAYEKLIEVCQKWRRSGIPVDVPSEQLRPLDVSLCSIKNTRRRMEDRHIVVSDLNHLFRLKGYPAQSFMAVLDGHRGAEAAVYASTQIHVNMVRHKAFSSDPEKAILSAYNLTDQNFIYRCKQENIQSGTTCISMLVRGKKVYLAWLGDSQAVLVRNGQPLHLTDPHKPDRQDERERIEGMGGCVLWFGTWRVSGTLSVSRAIGDVQHKPYVCSDADIMSFDLDGSEEFLVIGCDGLWDTLGSDSLVSLVNDHLKESDGDRSTVAQKLVRTAKENGSTDNITVIVVFFNHSLISQVCTESSDKLEERISDVSEQDSSGNKQDKMEKDSQESEKACKNDSQKGSSQGVSDSSQHTSSNSMLYPDDYTASSKSDSQRPVKSSSREDSASTNHSLQSLANHSRESPAQTNQSAPTKASPEPSNEHSNGQSHELPSDTSATDLALMAKTARCVSNRRAKRSRSGSKNGSKSSSKGSKNGSRNARNGRGKENRRALRGRLGAAGLLPYTNSRGPTRSRSAESNLSLAQKNMLRSGDQIFQMLTGCSPNVIRKVKSPVGKWTVAVEIESASAMFEERTPLWEKARRRSDTDHHYKK